MSEIDRIKRFLGRKIPVEMIDLDGNKEIFELKPFTIEQKAMLLEIYKRTDKDNPDNIANLGQKELVELKDIFISVLQNSMDEFKNDPRLASEFVDSNFTSFCAAIGILMPEERDESAVDKIKKKQEEFRNARKSK